jgi:hypothetical protein
VGGARTLLDEGHLFHFNLTGNRRKSPSTIPTRGPHGRQQPQVRHITESDSLLIGRNFGIVTDIQTGPNGNLFVVSLTEGAIHEIFRR